MIPKIVHYCWFGGKEIPEKEKECISTWGNFFPSYEFKFWNEENFDYISNNYARQAYETGKYAFVSDYARAKVLYDYGGVYLDTDVKILKSLPFADGLSGIMGFETKSFIGTAVIASEPANNCIKELLDYYENHDFLQTDGTVDNIANTSILTDIMVNKGLCLGGNHQKVAGYVVYPREYFYPKKISETEFHIVDETCAIHMCSNSWLSEREKKRGTNRIWINFIRPLLRKIRRAGIRIVGAEKMRTIEIKLRNKLH